MYILLLCGSIYAFSQPYTGEKLSRGLVGIPTDKGMYFSWRMTLDDAPGLQFDIYRSTNGGAAIKLNKEPISKTADFLDEDADFKATNHWILKADNREVATWTHSTEEVLHPYLSIPIRKPEDGEIAGEHFFYTANDCSVGDLDGDGEYEIILKWSPSNSKRPPQRGFTGNTYLDAYKMDGTLLWDRISVQEQPQLTSLSLILMEMGVPKSVAKQETEPWMEQDILSVITKQIGEHGTKRVRPMGK